METTIYEDQSLLFLNKNSYPQDNGKMWLNLPNDCKNAVKKEEFDISDLLRSPDIGISSPDLETIVWRNFPETCSEKEPSTSPPAPLLLLPQEDYSSPQVTAEQEVFARGFTDALQRLREEREVVHFPNSEEASWKESSKPVDDSKCCFISYRFDSSYHLPPFKDAFLPAKLTNRTKSKPVQEVDTCIFKERETVNHLEESEFSGWFKVETLEEGFSGQQQCSLKDCLSNYSGEDESDLSSTCSPLPFSSTAAKRGQEYCYEEFEGDCNAVGNMDFHDGVDEYDSFEASDGWTEETSDMFEEKQAHKDWLTVNTKLYNLSEPVQEVDSLEEDSQTTAILDETFNARGSLRTDRKRHKNRLASWKCRQKKLERESKLETTVEELYVENSRLMTELEKLRRKRRELEQTFIRHLSGGCDEAHMQYAESFNVET